MSATRQLVWAIEDCIDDLMDDAKGQSNDVVERIYERVDLLMRAKKILRNIGNLASDIEIWARTPERTWEKKGGDE